MGPVMWGAFVWFMGWGYGATLIPYYPINYVIRILIALVVTGYFFGVAFQGTYKKYKLTFFHYSFDLPSWLYFVGLTVVAAFVSVVPYTQSYFISSLMCGVIVSAIIEELVARSFFVKYAMGVKEFIFFNIVSSLAFTFMHAFYEQGSVPALEFMQRGHFAFSFMLGVIVYKTQRIELSMLLHMLSNMLRYTVPVCLLQCPWPSSIAIVLAQLADVVMILALGIICRKQK